MWSLMVLWRQNFVFVFLMLRCYHLAQDILAASHREAIYIYIYIYHYIYIIIILYNIYIYIHIYIYITFYDSLAKICHMTSPSHQKSRRAILLCTWEKIVSLLDHPMFFFQQYFWSEKNNLLSSE